MRRRVFIAGLGSAAVWPHVARAQQQAMPVIGFLSSASPREYGHVLASFRRGLGEAGYVEDRNVAIDFRWAEGQFERLPTLASELVRRQVAVIVAGGSPLPGLAAKGATSTIPIVFIAGDDPIDSGLVTSISRPERNVTGVSMFSAQLVAKRFELLRSLVPTSRVIGLVANAMQGSGTAIQITAMQTAATALALQIQVVNAASERELEAAFAALADRRVDAVMIAADSSFNIRRASIVALAARYAIPASYSLRDFVEAGGLMSYGTSITEAYRQAGIYAGQLLKGAKLGDLPVLLPTKFELVINLKTAKALGLTIPETLLATADEVIQ
jgi:putative tryptophan/tyrosine transport system substrate-binding protein